MWIDALALNNWDDDQNPERAHLPAQDMSASNGPSHSDD